MNRAPQGVEGRRRPSVLRNLLNSEAASGLALMAAAALALAVANTPIAPAYFEALESHVGPLSLLGWVNDALMALFFLLVGLEIKRELIDGQLSTWSRRTLPGLAALGGMVVPAILFIGINWGNPVALRGWAVPTATDIAFALGVLRLLGPGIPISLKVFLTALAIIDDLAAVAIIAMFYSSGISPLWLGAAVLVFAALYALNRLGVARLLPYLALGVLLWLLVLKSGIHPTLAGVALALTIPLRKSPGRPDDEQSPLHRLENWLGPWVAFLVLPIFGFANAGIALSDLAVSNLVDDVPLGIAAGLFLGKQIGVFSFTWTAIRLGLADCPKDASMPQLYGISLLCGIGFTMSLFIGLLAFPGAHLLQDEVKIGVLLGSFCSALVGAVVLKATSKRRAGEQTGA